MKLDEFRSRRPIDIIAKTNPVLIIDEPQSVEGKQTKERLREFHPLFIFAALVEFSQMFHIVEVLGWQDNRFLSVLVGSVFDWKDILCYVAGCILLGVYEVLVRNTARRR